LKLVIDFYKNKRFNATQGSARMKRVIPFSPPDIDERDVDGVVEVLKSGWITTGPKTKEFEKQLSRYCQTKSAVALSSATAGLFLILKMFGVKKGDEVITTPYTFVATSNVILNCDATPVFVDINREDFNLNYDKLEKSITEKTKAVISVDYGGWPVDYERIGDILASKKGLFRPSKGTLQEFIDAPLFISDAAHSFGASYKGKKVGSGADFTVFSFHAVKNLTTAEGGGVTFSDVGSLSFQDIYKKFMLYSLHGQNKDALEKYKNNSWRYDIELAGYKFNMTDILASLGLTQLARYDGEILPKREKIFSLYKKYLSKSDKIILPEFDNEIITGSKHLFPIRLRNYNETKRDELMKKLLEEGISSNVHFIPIPMFSLYKSLGYDIEKYPESYRKYENLISLPMYSKLIDEDVEYICSTILRCC